VHLKNTHALQREAFLVHAGFPTKTAALGAVAVLGGWPCARIKPGAFSKRLGKLQLDQTRQELRNKLTWVLTFSEIQRVLRKLKAFRPLSQVKYRSIATTNIATRF
jgi:hypothetical protein